MYQHKSKGESVERCPALAVGCGDILLEEKRECGIGTGFPNKACASKSNLRM